MQSQMKISSVTVGFSLQNQPSHDLEAEQPQHIPLLLQKSYARSKSSIHDELRHIRISLRWCALDHSTSLGKNISYVTFIILAIIVPILSAIFIKIPSSEDTLSYNKLLQVPESGLAFLGFYTLCRFFKEYGLRKLLFLDGLNDDSLDVQRGYKFEVDKAFKNLAFILLPSFLVEFAHKIIFFLTVAVSLPFIGNGASVVPMNSIMFVTGLASWVYRTGVFLLVCVLFRLTCKLQILRLEGLRSMLEGGFGSQPDAIFREHVRIKDQLYVTSQRFRFFIVGCLVIITVSQLGALLLVLASKSKKTFFNSGDLMVSSAVELSGCFLCLMGAAKITHRAQGIVSVATKWQMLVSSCYNDGALEPMKDAETPAIDTSAVANNAMTRSCDGYDQSSVSGVAVKLLQDPHAFHTRQALGNLKQHLLMLVGLIGTYWIRLDMVAR
ncbi:Tumor necrosis factor ligand superfamily member 4 [Bienertia sinuspersici]